MDKNIEKIDAVSPVNLPITIFEPTKIWLNTNSSFNIAKRGSISKSNILLSLRSLLSQSEKNKSYINRTRTQGSGIIENNEFGFNIITHGLTANQVISHLRSLISFFEDEDESDNG